WGLKAELYAPDTSVADGIVVKALAFGGDHVHHFEWPGTRLHGDGPHRVRTTRDTVVRVVVHDASHTVPDTAWLRIAPRPGTSAGTVLRRDQATITTGGSGGSDRHYVGAFEVLLDDPRRLDEMDQLVYRRHLPPNMRSLSARDRFPEIFGWLELLDTNVWVVIVLMVVVAIINMASALLVLILERTRMIGVLKAMGATDGAVRRVFLMVAAMVLGVGILLGDIVGIGLCLLQQRFGIVTLPMESYYVDAVPVDLAIGPIVLLNIGTLAVCIAALVLPSMLVARIAPARTVRFD
ncbi:MAG: FtsX-like permease family protein, partial [Flavobacteriales bacterium]|nr:FtsX-like permease family protein [Flavobacteriales bacterium]